MSRQRLELTWRDPWAVVQALTQALGAQGLVWLDGGGSPQAERSLLAVNPVEQVQCRGLPGSPGSEDPFRLLAELAASNEPWLGWLSYEAGAWVEPGNPWPAAEGAMLQAVRPDPLLEWDHGNHQLRLEGNDDDRLAQFAALIDTIGPSSAPPQRGAPALALEGWHWHTSPQDFAEAVRQVKRWIASGDLFQANLTACCEQWLDPAPSPEELLALYGRLRHSCAAPFSGLAISAGASDTEAVLCASPERFLRLDPSGAVETRPIKGTRPRHPDPDRDAAAAAQLITSPKDRAENVMIVDLLRNDLGRVCQPGSIQVPQLVGLESYPQVHHLTSVVEGQLRAGLDVATLLRACWPGGSISGAPKIRACQRLTQLEPVPRGPYTGSLFALDGRGGFDSNIVIRSLVVNGARVRAHAGCGIVADSDPEEEAEEMGWKLQPLLEAVQ